MLLLSRILIVEDEEILAENLKTFLSRLTSEVQIAADANSAMDLLKAFTPDLVILDYALSGIDGLRVYSNIVGDCFKPPLCILITDSPTDLIIDRAQRLGIHHVLCKPFRFAALQRAIGLIGSNGNASVDFDRRRNERRNYRILWCRTDRRHQWSRRGLQNPQSQGSTTLSIGPSLN